MEKIKTEPKTPGDLKKEEEAQKLGEGWRFWASRLVLGDAINPNLPDQLEGLKREGKIEDWFIGPDFWPNGEEKPHNWSQGFYVKVKGS